MDSKIIGAQIRAARLEKNLSQKELAQLISVSTTQVTRYESGDNETTSLMLYQISIVLEKPIDFFYGNMRYENNEKIRQDLITAIDIIKNGVNKIEEAKDYFGVTSDVKNSNDNFRQRVAKKQFRNQQNISNVNDSLIMQDNHGKVFYKTSEEEKKENK